MGRKTTLRDDATDGPKRAEWIYDTAARGIGKLAKSIRYVGSTAYQTRVDGYDTGGLANGTTLVLPSSEGKLCAAGGTKPCEYSTTTTYRVDGAVNKTTLPAAADLDKETLVFGYNDIGEQTTLLSAGQIYVFSATYDKIGELTQRTLGAVGSQVAITSTFDEPTRRLTSTNVVPELKAEAADWSYDYYDSGDTKRISEAPSGQAADNQCFTYEYLARLTNAWTPSNASCDTAPTTGGLGGPAPYWHSWTYDLSGNRGTEVRHAGAGNTTDTYRYPNPGPTAVRPHAVTEVETAAPGSTITRGYTYDNGGNTATRSSDAGNRQSLTYDAEGHAHRPVRLAHRDG